MFGCALDRTMNEPLNSSSSSTGTRCARAGAGGGGAGASGAGSSAARRACRPRTSPRTWRRARGRRRSASPSCAAPRSGCPAPCAALHSSPSSRSRRTSVSPVWVSTTAIPVIRALIDPTGYSAAKPAMTCAGSRPLRERAVRHPRPGQVVRGRALDALGQHVVDRGVHGEQLGVDDRGSAPARCRWPRTRPARTATVSGSTAAAGRPAARRGSSAGSRPPPRT